MSVKVFYFSPLSKEITAGSKTEAIFDTFSVLLLEPDLVK